MRCWPARRHDAIAALDAEGGRLGLAFQLVDDLIGAFGSAEQAGRDEGGDLRESKRTPLIALARQTPTVVARQRRPGRRAHRARSRCAKRSSRSRRAAPDVRLRALIDDTLEQVRAAVGRPGISRRAARPLLRELADRVEERIP